VHLLAFVSQRHQDPKLTDIQHQLPSSRPEPAQ
jgi:hypothetical protein